MVQSAGKLNISAIALERDIMDKELFFDDVSPEELVNEYYANGKADGFDGNNFIEETQGYNANVPQTVNVSGKTKELKIRYEDNGTYFSSQYKVRVVLFIQTEQKEEEM